jgi:NADPH:quinone reductase-like Zn-dependent oxidoreductase
VLWFQDKVFLRIRLQGEGNRAARSLFATVIYHLSKVRAPLAKIVVAEHDGPSAMQEPTAHFLDRRHDADRYSFLFMRASGDQLREIDSLIDSGAIRPVVDQVFPFASTNEAMAYVGEGRAQGKVIVRVR